AHAKYEQDRDAGPAYASHARDRNGRKRDGAVPTDHDEAAILRWPPTPCCRARALSMQWGCTCLPTGASSSTRHERVAATGSPSRSVASRSRHESSLLGCGLRLDDDCPDL